MSRRVFLAWLAVLCSATAILCAIDAPARVHHAVDGALCAALVILQYVDQVRR